MPNNRPGMDWNDDRAEADRPGGGAEIRKAEDEAKDGGRLGARVVRRTLRISALGRDLWRACRRGVDTDVVDPGPERQSDADALDSYGVAPILRGPVPSPVRHESIV